MSRFFLLLPLTATSSLLLLLTTTTSAWVSIQQLPKHRHHHHHKRRRSAWYPTINERLPSPNKQNNLETFGGSTTALFHDWSSAYDDDEFLNDGEEEEEEDWMDDQYGLDGGGMTADHEEAEEELEEDMTDDKEQQVSLTPSTTTTTTTSVRASIVGVSVERETGFWVMLQLPTTTITSSAASASPAAYCALQVTNDPLDRMAASSGHALTLVQLLSQVDMAGAILPPHVLAQLVTCALEEEYCCAEQQQQQQQQQQSSLEQLESSWQLDLIQHIQHQIGNLYRGFASSSGKNKEKAVVQEDDDKDDEFSYTDESTWIRSRVRLPLCTLDQVHLDLSSLSSDDNSATTIGLDVVVRNNTASTTSATTTAAEQYKWTLPNLTESTSASVLNDQFQPVVSRQFLAMALLLRYKAPLMVTLPPFFQDTPDARQEAALTPLSSPSWLLLDSDAALKQAFPLYTTVANLQQSSNRVAQNIERGFEIHQLQAALQMARKRQDFAAMTKIRAKLDELDTFSDLPVQPESDMDCMQ